MIGKLQNVNPDPHEFHTVIGDTSTGTQQQKMLEFFANTILNQTYETPDGDYWGKVISTFIYIYIYILYFINLLFLRLLLSHNQHLMQFLNQ